jgi:hypothetical protein
MNTKSEIRNPKLETNSKDRNLNIKTVVDFGFILFEHSDLFRISDFEFRIFALKLESP